MSANKGAINKRNIIKLEKILNQLPERAVEEVIDFAEFLKIRKKGKKDAPTSRKSSFFQLFGEAGSGYTNVSSDKYRHLTEIYSESHKNGL